ncbi:MAG: response regulator transcription factor [Anaerolineales bacterium]|nr:response regulator transcription factor [Anaerolineales bacterium]MCB9109687.1 response regulator transcription factor [Anaerolineales bacterium]
MNATGHILIIDDEASLRKTMARILQQAGFEVTTAESAEQGLDFLKTTQFDMVLSDLRMPGMHGMEALKVIHAEHPNLPVVLFTAQPDVNSAVEALRHGATDYLLKPIKPEAIIERTRSILMNQQREKRKREIQLQIESLQDELKSLEDGEPANKASQPLSPASLEKERFLKRGPLVLDLHTRRVLVNEEPLNTPPPTSFEYLLVLARHSPDVVDYQTLVAEAQGYQTDPREAQELAKYHIHQLRQIIEADVRNPAYLLNVRGTGYRLVAD